MARAKRHFLPGYLWHITHRCHKREFLLKFSKDRDRYLRLLYQAKKQFNLRVLNYMVTSNHVHLLVDDGGEKEVIPRSMQLVAGRVAQKYNRRRNRSGAFWEDRYHATAIEGTGHLFRCMVYIDLNMVRAGSVDHPSEWKHSGYCEIQMPPQRYGIIDRERLKWSLGIAEGLPEKLKNCVNDALRAEKKIREKMWTESIAVGSRDFIEIIKGKLTSRGKGRSIRENGDVFHLREPEASYRTVSGTEKWL